MINFSCVIPQILTRVERWRVEQRLLVPFSVAATRETALLHAISNAAITHEVTLQCRQNKIPGCHCVEKNKHNSGNGEWQWGGCGDNIWFGENTTKSFIDVLEPQEESARRAVNLHNNEIGRRVNILPSYFLQLRAVYLAINEFAFLRI